MLPTTVFVSVSIGGSQAIIPAGTTPNYSLPNVPAGRRDLIAAQEFSSGGTDTVVQKMIIRRNVQYANAATAPDLDFIGVESFVPVNHAMKLSNLCGDQSHATLSFVTANGQSAEYFSSAGRFFPAFNSDGVLSYGMPDSLFQAGDFHFSTVFAATSDGKSGRIVESMNHSLLGSDIHIWTRTLDSDGVVAWHESESAFARSVAVSKCVQWRGDRGVRPGRQLGSRQRHRRILWRDAVDLGHRCAEFAGAGYDASWGLRSGTTLSWLVVAVGGNILPFVGATSVDGAQIVAGFRTNSSASFSVARRRK